MTTISNRLQDILATIQSAAASSPSHQQVQLLAVSKAQSAAAIRDAYAAGQIAFGENYSQEALEKQKQLTDLAIEWHFIGPIQSNKTQLIAQNFSWVHSVDRLKIAQRLNEARSSILRPLQVCIQVNVSNEESKSGVLPDQLEALAVAINVLPNLKLRGLMAIPAPTTDQAQQIAQFKQVRECYDALIRKGFALDTLSIGMSNDYQTAITQGATIVRIGSALFGARAPLKAA
ncbi:YggS family pyridoxal phosphate-dependent enzyme [Methylotenera oryzisoli]|uniref:Pyridoxal phosphate homeostasis protein n=1 Tax=Methylotenera oryzisoli TaxID=2080758 RepID=A0A4Y9VUC6_9PROT|nr:YggS family pyridoxal phosphate-dependent enzyme [Methylotenera oryzisoli]TFW73325.1 YggS family pyridoxal phosphate-dependent enzyme [Methylotenera oryzisoli]